MPLARGNPNLIAFPGGRVSGYGPTPIQTDQAGLAAQARFLEMARKYISLSPTDRGTKFTLGGAAWAKIFSDWPVTIYVNQQSSPFTNVKRLDFFGRVNEIEAVRMINNVQGVFKIIAGWPGEEAYQERDPRMLPTLPLAVGGTWLNGSPSFTSSIITVPVALVSSECIWARCLSIGRSGGGTISRVRIFIDYGGGVLCWDEQFLGAAVVTLAFSGREPLKIADNFFITLDGNVIAADTTVTANLIYNAQ